MIACASLLCVHASNGSPDRAGRVTEVIIFSLNRPGNTDDQNVLIRAARSLRRAKGVDHFHIGRSLPGPLVAGEQAFDVALVITFKNRAAWEKFERNENFRRLINGALRPLVRRSFVYNFASE